MPLNSHPKYKGLYRLALIITQKHKFSIVIRLIIVRSCYDFEFATVSGELAEKRPRILT